MRISASTNSVFHGKKLDVATVVQSCAVIARKRNLSKSLVWSESKLYATNVRGIYLLHTLHDRDNDMKIFYQYIPWCSIVLDYCAPKNVFIL